MTDTLNGILITTEQFEDAVEAFAEAKDGSETPDDLPGVPYRNLPNGSQEWYRARMRAALDRLGITVGADPSDT